MAAHPFQQVPVAVIGRGKLLMTRIAAVLVDNSGVVGVFLGVDTTDGTWAWLVMLNSLLHEAALTDRSEPAGGATSL